MLSNPILALSSLKYSNLLFNTFFFHKLANLSTYSTPKGHPLAMLYAWQKKTYYLKEQLYKGHNVHPVKIDPCIIVLSVIYCLACPSLFATCCRGENIRINANKNL